MPVDEIYRKQAALLIRVIPLVATETCFALKGGTAINLFVRNMPRLSVDIDLTYLPIADRAASLKEIGAAMRRIAETISRGKQSAAASRVHLSTSAGWVGMSGGLLPAQTESGRVRPEVRAAWRRIEFFPPPPRLNRMSFATRTTLYLEPGTCT